ncbi:MAG: hypothetical protein EOO28_21260 [Comamonadaceae bacterium]|nr:MAG: hypothetical protein EOO28_21260 [Comamonadaceae bacterium]
MAQDTPPERSQDVLHDVRIGDFAGRDGVYFNAGLAWSHRKFVVTRDALEKLDDAVLPSPEYIHLAFDKHVKKISEKVVNILSVGAHVGNPIVLQASDFEH